MNKHLETLVGFKNGTKKIAKEQFYELWDAWDHLVEVIKKISYALFVLVVWFVSLALICILPLATHIRLKWEKQYQEEYEAEVKRVKDSYTSLNRGEK